MMRVLKIAYLNRLLLTRFAGDKRGMAAVEFAFIVPLMLALLFGTIDLASSVAIDRKVTLAARTLSDLVSQGTQVSQTDLKNFFGLGGTVMTPYPVSTVTLTQTISAVSIDALKKVTVVWSYKGAVNNSTATVSQGYTPGYVVTTIPVNLLVPNTQLIWSEVTYSFTPITGYVMGTAVIPLSEQTFTRPRQSATVDYTS